MKDKQLVVIATKDIAKGATFKEGENYGVIAMDKKFVFEDYIKYDGSQKKELEGKKANSPILKSEVLTKGRISEDKPNESTFRLFVKPNAKSDVEKGDRVNVYVKLEFKDPKVKDLVHYQTFWLMKDKIVQDVVMKKDSKGADLKVLEYIELEANEEDSVKYHLAEYLKNNNAQIVVLEYKDALSDGESSVKSIDEIGAYNDLKELFIKSDNSNPESQKQANPVPETTSGQ